MLRFSYFLCVGLLLASPAPGADSVGEEAPRVEDLGGGRFRLGQIEFDAGERSIRIPCEVNTKTDVLEYVLVHEQGKTHESLLATAVSPLHLQVVLKLLSYPEGRGDLLDGYLPPGQAPPPPVPAGQRVELLVEWEGKAPFPVNEAIRDRTADAPLTAGPWILTGSEVIAGKFQAEVEGSIVALYRDPLAMFNSPHERMKDDENWFPIDPVLPEAGRAVTLIIRPYSLP